MFCTTSYISWQSPQQHGLEKDRLTTPRNDVTLRVFLECWMGWEVGEATGGLRGPL